MRTHRHYEEDAATFDAPAYHVQGHEGVAWHVLGWETAPDEDTEWSGIEERTGKVVAIMVGDDTKFTFDQDDLQPLKRGDYCAECGQVGCHHDGYDASEDEDTSEWDAIVGRGS